MRGQRRENRGEERGNLTPKDERVRERGTKRLPEDKGAGEKEKGREEGDEEAWLQMRGQRRKRKEGGRGVVRETERECVENV
jgi:hypothetical protein